MPFTSTLCLIIHVLSHLAHEQGVAYGILCGVPAQYGLYSCIIPPLIYSIFGNCPQLSLGTYKSVLSVASLDVILKLCIYVTTLFIFLKKCFSSVPVFCFRSIWADFVNGSTTDSERRRKGYHMYVNGAFTYLSFSLLSSIVLSVSFWRLFRKACKEKFSQTKFSAQSQRSTSLMLQSCLSWWVYILYCWLP